MIVGVGMDVVDVERFVGTLRRTPRLLMRLFTETERTLPDRSLAARFAAKEALAKALGSPPGLAWTDVTITRGPHGAPRVEMRASVLARARELGVDAVHVSLSHDGGLATALVVAECQHEPRQESQVEREVEP